MRRRGSAMRRHAVAFGLVLFALVASLGAVSAQRVVRQMKVARACTAAIEGRFEEALAQSEGLAASDPDGRLVAECRCRALDAGGQPEACLALLERVVAAAPGWSPSPDLAARLVRARRERGDLAGAAAFARQAVAVHRGDAALALLEIEVRSVLEGEDAVLAALEQRVAEAAPGSWQGTRLALGVVHSRRDDPAGVVRVLGSVPPEEGDAYRPLWLEARSWALDRIAEAD